MAMMNPGAGMMAPNPMQNNEGMQAPTESPMGAPMGAPMDQAKGLNISGEQFNEAMNGLEQNEIASLDQHLTPPVKIALGKLLGQEVLQVIEPLGPNEPTVSLPVSVVASAYPADNIVGARFAQIDPYNAWERETQWSINTGTLVEDSTLSKLECDHTIDDGVKTYNESHPEYTSANGKIDKTRYCASKLWSSKEITTSYSVRLETYKQYEIKNTDGSNLVFAEPKTLYFTAPDTDKFGDDRGKKFRLELNGDYLNGVPGSVIDISTGEDKGEYVQEWNENYRWVQRFIIPDGSVLSQNTSTDTYLVKALAGQEWLGKKDSAIGSLSALLTSKTKEDLLSNRDLRWEVMSREVNIYDCSLERTYTDSDGNTYTETDWEACYELDPDDAEMVWYETPHYEHTGEVGTTINNQSKEWPIAGLKELDRCHVGQKATLVRTDVPHTVDMGNTDRWAVSFRIISAQSWQTHITVLENYIQK